MGGRPRVLVTVIVAAAVAVVGLPTLNSRAVAAGTPDADVTSMQAGIASWVTLLEHQGAKGLSTVGRFGQPLPVSGVVLGAPSALGLNTMFDVLNSQVAASHPTTFADLARVATNGLDIDAGANPRHAVITAVVAAAVAPSTVETLTVGMTVSRTIDAGFAISSLTPKLELASAHGVATHLTLKSTFTFAYDSATSSFFVVSSPSTPAIRTTVTTSIPDVTKLDPAVGILAFNATAATFAYSANLTAAFIDTKGSGRLAFTEPDASGGTHPGVLALPATAATLATADFSPSPTSSVTGSFQLDSAPSGIPGLTIPPLSISATVDDPDLSTTTPPTVTTQGITSLLSGFEGLTAKDLATSIARLTETIHEIQLQRFASPGTGDVDLPFLKGKLADAIHAYEAPLAFLTQQVDPTTGSPNFVSLQEFLRLLNATTTTTGASIAISNATFDATTSKLSYELKATRAAGHPEDLSAGPGDPTGTVSFGNALHSATGLKDVTAAGAKPAAKTNPSYILDVTMVTDLTPSSSQGCNQPTAPNPPDPSNPENKPCPYVVSVTNPANPAQILSQQVVAERPLPADRFLIRTGGSAVLTADTTVTSPVGSVTGAVDFVQASLSGGQITADKPAAASHMVSISIKSQGDTQHDVRLGVVGSLLHGNPSALLDYPTALQASASGLTAAVPLAPHFFDGADASLGLTLPDAFTPSGLIVNAPGVEARLKPLAFGTAGASPEPSALRGKLIASLAALADALSHPATLAGPGAPAYNQLSANLQVLGQPFASYAHSPELTSAVGALTQQPPDTLQQLLALVPGVTGFHVDQSQTPPALIVDLDLVHSIGSDPASEFGLEYPPAAGGTAQLTGTGAGGKLPVTGTSEAKISLEVALRIANPSDPPPAAANVMVLPTSTLTIAPVVSTTSGRLTGAAGALALNIGDPAPGATNLASIDARPTLTLTGSGSTPVSLSDWLGAAKGLVGGGAGTCPSGEIICATMPADTSNGTALGNFTVDLTATNAFAGSAGSGVAAPAALATTQASTPLAFPTLASGLDPYLTDLVHGLDTASLGGKVPLVGSDLEEGSSFIEKLKTRLDSSLANFSVPTATPHVSDVQTALETALKAAGAGPVAVSGPIKLTFTCGAGTCQPTDDAAAITGVDVAFHVGQGEPTTGGCTTGCDQTSQPFAIGIPGLRLSSTAAPSINLGWGLDLAFGFDKTDGFFIDASKGANQLAVGLSVQAGDFTGQLGFLSIDARNLNGPCPPPSASCSNNSSNVFAGQFSVGLSAPSGKITLDQLSNGVDPTAMFNVGLSAKVAVDYHLAANAGSALPGISADLHLGWGWSNQPASATTPTILGFDHVQLDLSTVFSRVLGPMYDNVRKALTPLKPVIDAINAPLPGISDISRRIGAGDLSILTLMKLYGTTTGNDDYNELTKVAKLVSTVYQLGVTGTIDLGSFGVDPVKALAGVPTPDQVAGLLKGLDGLHSATDLLNTACSSGVDCTALGQLGQLTGDGNQVPPGGGLGFKLPLLDNPSSLAGVLLGQDVTLATFDTGTFHKHFDYTATLGPLGPFFVDLGVAATVDLRFIAGFDTYGIRKALEAKPPQLADLAQSFYLGTFDENGKPFTQIAISDATAYVDAKASVIVAEAGIRGDITLNANLTLLDSDSPQHPDTPGTGMGDGKVRLNEFGRDPATGEFDAACLFTSTGDISANLVLFVRINLGLYSHEWDDTLATARILNLDHNCDTPKTPPKLAHVVGNDLVVNVGKNGTAAVRGDGWGNDSGKLANADEATTVRALHDDGGTFTGFSVDLLRHQSQYLLADAAHPEYAHLNRVIVDAAGYGGKETVNLLGDGSATGTRRFDKASVILGGTQDDKIKVDNPAGVPTAVDGGQGNDTILVGDGPVTIAGGPGNDTVHVGNGANTVLGDAALAVDSTYAVSLPTLTVESATDGNDHISVGLGHNSIYGGGGDDTIDVAPDSALAPVHLGQPDHNGYVAQSDTIVGGTGDNAIRSGSGDDTIFAGQKFGYASPNDTGAPGDGSNFVDSGTGKDTVLGGSGDDRLVGHSLGVRPDLAAPTGPALAAQADTIYGGSGNDVLTGGDGADTIYGGPGDDYLSGGPATIGDTTGADSHGPTRPVTVQPDGKPVSAKLLVGGSGSDHVYGGNGGDMIYGDLVVDTCAAPSSGPDSTAPAETPPPPSDPAGTTYNDYIVAATGANVVSAGPGNDWISATGGADLLCGGAGNDQINGGAGNVTAWGGSGDDSIMGGSGDDHLYGNEGNDFIVGGTGNDYIEGNNGSDQIIGGSGNDHIIGGTSALGQNDQGDVIYGGTGTDVIIGDNGTIAADGTVTVFDLTSDPITTGYGGNDRIYAGAGDDRAFGGIGNDQIYSGSAGGDHLEGGPGNDTVIGTGGQNDIIGGSSPLATGGSYVPGLPDGGNTLDGRADGQDTIVGNNGSITRTTKPIATDFHTPSADGGIERHVQLLDLTSANGGIVSGLADTIYGGQLSSELYGGPADDHITGGPGDDYIEGGPGADTLRGGGGDDDLIGGVSPRALGAINTSSVPDGGNVIFGDGGNDLIVGNNGSILRPVDANGLWQHRPADGAIVRTTRLLDITMANRGTLIGGSNFIDGGTGNDEIYGGPVADTIFGGAGDDRIEAGGGSNLIYGDCGSHPHAGGTAADPTEALPATFVTIDPSLPDACPTDGQDDIIGGSSPRALGIIQTRDVVSGSNTIYGEGGGDVIIGNNGDVLRPLDGNSHWITSPADGNIVRVPTVLDSLSTLGPVDGSGDVLYGGDQNDHIWGGPGSDYINGGAADDYLEGGPGSDTILGGTGNDDIVGGTSTLALPASSNSPTSIAANAPDGTPAPTQASPANRTGNNLYGLAPGETTTLADDDVLVGNNGNITRPIDGAGHWTRTDYGYGKADVMAGTRKQPLGAPITRTVDLLGSESLTETTHNGNDYIEGNSGNDVIYGENGNDILHGDTPAAGSPRTDECLPTIDPTAGQDVIIGGYGNDNLCGDGGDDALVGDRGVVTVQPFSGATATDASGGPPNLTASYPASGNSIYQTTLIDPTNGGDDILFGGQGNDSLHGGAGNDFLQGDDGLHIAGHGPSMGGNDILFGGDGNDSLQGGPGSNHLYGGNGNDDLNVLRSTIAAPKLDDSLSSLPALFPTIDAYTTRFPLPPGGSYDADQVGAGDPSGITDILYGGDSRDLLQAIHNDGSDRLADEQGNYNLFYVCGPSYGGAKITRAMSPGVRIFFTTLAQADGASGASDATTSGGNELSLLVPGNGDDGRAYPGTPGHFTCP